MSCFNDSLEVPCSSDDRCCHLIRVKAILSQASPSRQKQPALSPSLAYAGLEEADLPVCFLDDFSIYEADVPAHPLPLEGWVKSEEHLVLKGTLVPGPSSTQLQGMLHSRLSPAHLDHTMAHASMAWHVICVHASCDLTGRFCRSCCPFQYAM